jgi:hypothetical protein
MLKQQIYNLKIPKVPEGHYKFIHTVFHHGVNVNFAMMKESQTQYALLQFKSGSIEKI